ncbi:hypothetical protein BGX31_009501 [Mortierella sp. GBA43]|nr:hypothetical protein BGX31_009501 [Mortierella sp. GBA43]
MLPPSDGALSPSQLLRLTELHLEDANKLDDHDATLLLYQHAKAALHQAEGDTNKSLTTTDPEEQDTRDKIATAYHSLGERLGNQSHQDMAQAFFTLSEEWRGHVPESVQQSTSSTNNAMTINDPSCVQPTCALGLSEIPHEQNEHGWVQTPTTDVTRESKQDDSLNRRSSVSSTISLSDQDPAKDEIPAASQGSEIDSALEWKCFVNEPSVLQFLGERAQREPSFKQQLLDYIEMSKSDKRWRVAASNAITILVRIGIQFNCADLRGVQIPRADLGYGVFDSAQLQGADLSQVNLQGIWLRHADLSNAHLRGVRFGEQPYLEQSDVPLMSAYSPDGKLLSVAIDNHSINGIYSLLAAMTTPCDYGMSRKESGVVL